MELAVTQHAYFGPTMAALGVLLAVCRIYTYPRWFDPLAAASSRTIESIFSRVFLVLLVPQNFELVVE